MGNGQMAKVRNAERSQNTLVKSAHEAVDRQFRVGGFVALAHFTRYKAPQVGQASSGGVERVAAACAEDVESVIVAATNESAGAEVVADCSVNR